MISELYFISSKHKKNIKVFVVPFSPRWFVLGISCCVPFVLISRVWRPLLIFLHLYFGPCSRDICIYFPTLGACIVHDVCMYAYSPPFGVIVAEFSLWKSSTLLNALGKHKLGPYPFKRQISKTHACKAPKANAKIMFLLPISKN